MTQALTSRERAKADRQAALLRAAARLFAEQGYAAVGVEEIGAAAGVSGPAIYRHFPSKQAILGRILLETSRMLLVGGTAVVADSAAASAHVDALIRFHVDFAITGSDVIRVQDRDFAHVSDDDRATVRRMQREYVELWVDALTRRDPGRARAENRLRAHACLGLINSTPHSIRALHSTRDRGGRPDRAAVRDILVSMARGALAG